jgi:tetratricopeptide (TPR) repeat protein
MRWEVVTMLMAVLFTVAALLPAQQPAQQDATPKKLFESGKYQEAIDRIKAQADAPREQIYLRALAHRKLNQNDEARETFNALGAGAEENAWKSIGASGAALIDGNMNDAAAAAKKAVELDGNSPQAQYQLGLIESARNNQPAAAAAFAKAAELDPQMAYAHYEAGMAFYKAKRVDRMAVYFENFLKLAPDAPEAPAVKSIMKTVRGR